MSATDQNQKGRRLVNKSRTVSPGDLLKDKLVAHSILSVVDLVLPPLQDALIPLDTWPAKGAASTTAQQQRHCRHSL